MLTPAAIQRRKVNIECLALSKRVKLTQYQAIPCWRLWPTLPRRNCAGRLAHWIQPASSTLSFQSGEIIWYIQFFLPSWNVSRMQISSRGELFCHLLTSCDSTSYMPNCPVCGSGPKNCTKWNKRMLRPTASVHPNFYTNRICIKHLFHKFLSANSLI